MKTKRTYELFVILIFCGIGWIGGWVTARPLTPTTPRPCYEWAHNALTHDGMYATLPGFKAYYDACIAERHVLVGGAQ